MDTLRTILELLAIFSLAVILGAPSIKTAWIRFTPREEPGPDCGETKLGED